MVVGQVENLNVGEGAETSRQLAEFVNAEVQYPQLWHPREGLRDLLKGVVEQVEDLEVLHHGHGRGKFYDLREKG